MRTYYKLTKAPLGTKAGPVIGVFDSLEEAKAAAQNGTSWSRSWRAGDFLPPDEMFAVNHRVKPGDRPTVFYITRIDELEYLSLLAKKNSGMGNSANSLCKLEYAPGKIVNNSVTEMEDAWTITHTFTSYRLLGYFISVEEAQSKAEEQVREMPRQRKLALTPWYKFPSGSLLSEVRSSPWHTSIGCFKISSVDELEYLASLAGKNPARKRVRR